MRPSIEEVGRNSEEAIQSALEKINLSREKVLVEILSDIKGFNTTLSRVKITPLGEAPEPLQASLILGDILSRMGFTADISLMLHDNEVSMALSSEFSGLLIGKNGMTIDAIQHIVNRILNKKYNGKWKAVIDIEGYRRRKETFLVNLARKTAQEVKETGESIELEPLNPHDRRIIHIQLKHDPLVSTESLGDGFLKSIMVFPITE